MSVLFTPIMIPRKYAFLLILLALLATVLVLLATSKHGVGLWPDAVKYIAVARNVLAGDGFVYEHAEAGPFTAWPPLFPMLLAVVSFIFQVDALVVAPIVNGVLFGLIVYLAGAIAIRWFAPNMDVAFLATLAIVVCVPLFEVAVLASSEPLFIWLVLSALICANVYQSEGSLAALLLFSVVVALASLTRYMGIALIPVGALLVIFSRHPLRTKFAHLLLLGFVTTVPMAIWLARNYALSGTLFGPRPSTIFTLEQNLNFTFNSVLKWYFPESIIAHRSILILLSAAVGFVVGVNAKTLWHQVKTAPIQVAIFLLFIAVYLAMLIVTSTLTAADEIGNRLLVPIYIPLTLSLFYIIVTLLKPFQEQFDSIHLNKVLIFGMCLWLLYPAQQVASAMRTYVQHGIHGYSNKEWKESSTIRYLLTHPIEEPVYSNYPDAIYILADINAKWSPRARGYNSLEVVHHISYVKDSWPPEKSAYLIWFDKEGMNFLFTLDELESSVPMQEVAHLSDGTIYLITK